jgi:Ca2+-binding EF-hand superfamily protein
MDNNTSTNVNKNDLETVMKDLEQKVNPKSLQEGISRLNESVKTNDLSILLEPMIAGSKEFESKIGRRMTYSEMRSMWG